MKKVCSKCGIEKDFSEFRKQSQNKDGLSYYCKSCQSKIDKDYRDKHRDEYRENLRRHYQKNKDKINECRRNRYNNDFEYRNKQQVANKNSRLKHLDVREASQKKYVESVQTFIDNELKTPCRKCGESKPWLIQFHHIKPSEKLFQIQATKSIKNLQEEAKKCICLCTNCHNEFHYFFGKKPNNPVESLNEYLSKEFDSNAAYLRKREGTNTVCKK